MVFRRNIDLPQFLQPSEPPEALKNILKTRVRWILAKELEGLLRSRFHLVFARLTKLDRAIYLEIFQKWDLDVTPNWDDLDEFFIITLHLFLKEGEDIIQLVSNPDILYTFNEIGRIATQTVEEITDEALDWELDVDDEVKELRIYIGPENCVFT